MLCLCFVLFAAVLFLAFLLAALLHQLNSWADLLEKSEPASNLRLPLSLRLRPLRRVCRAFNARLDGAQADALRARRSGEELQATMAAVSHDIRTPLAAACGYLELLRGESDPVRQEGGLAVIARRLQELETLLDELFLYTRLNAGQARVLQPARLVLWPLFCEAAAGLEPQLKQAGAQLQVDWAEETAAVWADRQALARVLRNLLLNAAQHGAGGLQVRQQGGMLLFANCVADPAAIDPQHMFDRFWRADAARGGGRGGAGLGLAIARELTEAMGGRLTATLEGQVLTVCLALRPAPAEKTE